MTRFLKIAAVSAALVVVLAAVTFFTQLDALIKAAIENVGPRVTQSAVRVKHVNISPLSGKGLIHGLVIGNPKGFEADTALKLQDVRVVLVPRSLTSDRIIIKELYVAGPEITYEITRSGNNLQALQKNVESFVPASKSEGKKASGAQAKLQIDLFTLQGARVHVRSHVVGNQELDITIPDLRLEGIGKGPQGATVSEAVSTIFRALTKSVMHSVATSGVLKDLNKAAQTAQSTIKKSIKGLFGK